MCKRRALLTVASTVALLLTFGSAAATANRSLVTSGGGRAISGGVRGLVFAGSNGLNKTCDITLNGSIHSSIQKTVGALMGFFTSMAISNCRNSLGISPTSLIGLIEARSPWHIRYAGFLGTLPNITGVLATLIGVKFLLRIEALSCLYESNMPMSTAGTAGERRYTIRTMSFARNTVRLIRAEGEEFFRRCPPTEETGAQAFTITPEVTLTLG